MMAFACCLALTSNLWASEDQAQGPHHTAKLRLRFISYDGRELPPLWIRRPKINSRIRIKDPMSIAPLKGVDGKVTLTVMKQNREGEYAPIPKATPRPSHPLLISSGNRPILRNPLELKKEIVPSLTALSRSHAQSYAVLSTMLHQPRGVEGIFELAFKGIAGPKIWSTYTGKYGSDMQQMIKALVEN